MERRAARAFLILAAFVFVILLLTAGQLLSSEVPRYAWATIAYAITVIAVDLIEALGLNAGRAWAVAAMRPILWIQLLGGIAGSVTMLAHGSIPIPIDIVVLVWALRGTPAVVPVPRFTAASLVLAMVSLALAANGLWLRPVFGAGGLLDVSRSDLSGQITADCQPGPTPETLTVTYRWSWQRSGPIGSGNDVVVIVWDGRDDDGNNLYILGDTPESGAGISADSMTGPAADAAEFFAHGHAASSEWGIDLAQQRFDPGEIRLVLQRAADHSQVGVAQSIEGIYFHAGVWRSDTALFTCTW